MQHLEAWGLLDIGHGLPIHLYAMAFHADLRHHSINSIRSHHIYP